MANEDENEKFVENVMHELAAFHITDKHKQSETMNPSENAASHQDVPSTNGSRSTENESRQPEPSRPSRIIKLSRPTNPFSSRSLRHSQSDADNPSSVNGSTNLSSTVPAPGSRLAALQRPGSPFSKYLQKAQGSALTAASKITRSATAPGSTTSGRDETEHAAANDPEQLPNGVDNEHETEQRRTVFPPKTQTTTVTRSVLLRRPHSPFNTGQSQLLLNKPAPGTVADEAGPTSPKSPLSEGPTSPTLPPRDVNQATDKAAIRNKLRANSFRLKDLLSSRPFVKSKQDGEQGSKDDSVAARRLSDRDRTHSMQEDPNVPARRSDNEVSAQQRLATDRTRWRVEGSSLPIRPRSRISERTPTTLISARSLRSRDLDKAPSTSAEQESVKASNNEELPKRDDCSSGNVNTNSQINMPNTDASQAMSNSFPSDPHTESHVPHTRVGVGATLLRSPRTRHASASSVPSRQNSETAEHETAATHNQNPTNVTEEHVYQKSKAISDLASPNDVNFVFDSETMVQSASSDDSPVHYEQRMTQSLYAGSGDVTRQKPVTASEPGTPITDTHTMQSSKSLENSLDAADFAKSSPGLKRSLAVTDLDQAMLDRDQQKLQSMFSREDSSSAKVEATNSSRDRQRSLSSSSQLETDIDVQQSAIHRAGRSPHIKQKAVQSLEEIHGPPSSPGVKVAAHTAYKPSVNLEDAVKWPMDIPGILEFRKMEVFEGHMLLNWLTGSIDKSHYLRLVMTKHDISVIACQICTCLVAAGVIKQLEAKDTETVFKKKAGSHITDKWPSVYDLAVERT